MEEENSTPLLQKEKVNPLLIDSQKAAVKNAWLRKGLIDNLSRVTALNASPDESMKDIYNTSTQVVDSGYGKEALDAELMNHAANQYRATFQDLWNSGGALSPDALSNTLRNIEVITDHYTDIDGAAQAIIDSRVPEGIDKIKAQRAAIHQAALTHLSNISEDQSFWDTAGNVAGMILSVDQIKDALDVAGDGSYSEEITRFKLLPPDEQLLLMPSIVEWIYKEHDKNPWKAAAAVEDMFADEDVHNSLFRGAALDAFLVYDWAKVLGAARSVGKSAAQVSVDNDALEEAAALQAASIEETTARAVGTTPMDVANSLNPHSTPLIDQGTSLDNVAAIVGKSIDTTSEVVPESSLTTNQNLMSKDTELALRKQETELEQAKTYLESQREKVMLSEGNTRRKIAQLKADLSDPTVSEARKKTIQEDIQKLEGGSTNLKTLKDNLKKVQEDLAELKSSKKPRVLSKDTQKLVDEAEAYRIEKSLKDEEELIKRTIKEHEFELQRLVDEKPSRGELKALVKEKEQLTQTYQELKKKRDAISRSAGGTKKSRAILGEERVAINDQMDDVKSRIARLQIQLDRTRASVTAEGDLTRMRQGKTPEDLQRKIDDIRSRLKAARQPTVSVQAETSRISQGVVPEELKPAIKAETEKQVIKMREEIAQVQQAKPLPEARAGFVIPKAELAAAKVRELMKVLKPSMLKEKEWAAAEKKAIEALQGQLATSGTELNSISVVERGSNYLKVKYKTISGEGEYTYRITHNDVGQTLSENELADFKQKFVNQYRRVFSQEVLLRALDSSITENTTFAGNQTARIKNKMSQVWKEAEAGLSKKELEEVDAVLLMGDQEGMKTGIEYYTIAQLRSGSLRHAGGNVIFTPRQIESYYMKRAMYRELHSVMDGIIRERLEFEGYEYYKYIDLNGVERNLIGRKKANFDFGDTKGTDPIFFPGDTSKVHVEAAKIMVNSQKYKDEGYRIVELLEPHKTKNGQEVKLALIKDGEGWSTLPDKILNYTPGYIPRVYRPGYFFVRNEASETRETLYAFETKAEAEKWAAEYSANGGKASVWADGEFGDIAKAVQDARGFGGFITGPRKSTPLMVKTATGEQELVRMSVGQSTERYLNNIAKVVPINEYRMAAMQRWENDVNALAKAKGRDTGIFRFDTPDEQINLPTDVKDLMLQTRQYIREVMGVAPQEETITESFMLGAANLMHGKKFLEPARDWALNHSKGSIQSWLKGHAFDLRLGWFNPRQIFVQAQNAQIAMLLEPTHALPSLMDTLKLRSIALLPEDKAITAGRALGFDQDTIDNLLQYNKSGLRDAISQNADYEVHRLGVAHNSMDVIRKARKTGRVFYEEGENFSRMVAWNIAKRKWKIANPKKAIDDDAIQQITKDSQGLLMNMQSENAAWWQKAPVLGMATQFMQVQAKFLENVMPRMWGGNSKWTRVQKLRVLSGQMFLYGAVGVPLVEEAASYVAKFTGQDPQEFIDQNPEWVTAINEGLVGTFNSLLGGDATNISEGMSLLGGFDETLPVDVLKAIVAQMTSGQEDLGFVETLSGPTTTTIKRFGDVISNAFITAAAFYTAPSLDVAYGGLVSNADSILNMTSTWSNAKKAYVLSKYDKLYSADGKLVATAAELGEMSLGEIFRVGMGFKTDLEVVYWSSKLTHKEQQQVERELQKDLEAVYREYNLTKNKELFEAKKAFILNSVDPMKQTEMATKAIDNQIFPESAVETQRDATLNALLKSGRTPTTAETQFIGNE